MLNLLQILLLKIYKWRRWYYTSEIELINPIQMEKMFSIKDSEPCSPGDDHLVQCHQGYSWPSQSSCFKFGC